MPRLPFGIADTQLPSTSGVRGGTVGIPVAQEPGVDAQAATLPGRALEQFGQQTEQAAQYLVRAETYHAQQARAQDVLDATISTQIGLQRYQAAIAERNAGDYRTLPDDVVTMGKELVDQVALERKLSPQGKALLRENFEASITKAQHNALELQTARKQQDGIFAFSTAVHQAQQQGMDARDESDLQMILGGFQGLLVQNVHAGNIHGDVAAKMYRDTELSVRGDRAERAIQGDPVGRFNELRAMAQGQAAVTPAFQNLPTPMIVPLMEKAAKWVGQAASLKEAEIRHTREVLKQEQDKVEGNLYANLYQYAPLPANRPQIQQSMAMVEDARQKGMISTDQYKALMTMSTAWDEKARTYTPTDDRPTLTSLENFLSFSRTPQDFTDFREALAAHMKSLTGETVLRLSKDAEAFSNTMHPLNREGARAGRQRIMDYGNVSGAMPAGMAATQLSSEEQARLRNALLGFQSAVMQLQPHEVDAQWQTIADEMIKTYLMAPSGATPIKGLSRPLQIGGPNGQIVPNAWWAEHVLSAQPNMTDAEKGRQLREYEQWAGTQQGKAMLDTLYVNPAVVPAPPAPAKPWYKRIFGTETPPVPAPSIGQPGGAKAFTPLRTRAGQP